MPRQRTAPPQVPGFPLHREFVERLSTLPFEEQVDRALNAIERSIEFSGTMQWLESLRGRLPSIPATTIPSPFGAVEIPPIELPQAKLPVLDDRRKQALKAAVAIDLSFLLAQIPLLGDALADVIEDIYANRIREILTPEELARYLKYDRVGPSTVAMIRTWAA